VKSELYRAIPPRLDGVFEAETMISAAVVDHPGVDPKRGRSPHGKKGVPNLEHQEQGPKKTFCRKAAYDQSEKSSKDCGASLIRDRES